MHQEVLQVDHEVCRWIDQVEDQQSTWKLKFSSGYAERVFQGPNLVNSMTQERMTRRIRQLGTADPAWDHTTKRPRLVLAETGAHSGARMCNTMEELAGKETATKARRHREPPG